MKSVFNKFIRTAISASKWVYFLFLYARIYYRSLFKINHEKDIELISSMLINNVDVALDIGANRGDLTQSLLWRNCHVIAIEPDKASFDVLKKRFDKNPKVESYNFGCGANNGYLNLYTPRYDKYSISGMSSTNKDYVIDINEQFKALKPFYFFNKEKLHLDTKRIEIKTIDSFNLNPDFIKIDTEGTEFEIIQGAKETILRSKPILYIENPKPELIQFLSDMGYRILRKGSNNTIFVHENKSTI